MKELIILISLTFLLSCENTNLETNETTIEYEQLKSENDSLKAIIKNNRISTDLIELGLKNPQTDLLNSLQKRTDLFPIKGELGTKMHFGSVKIINENWILAEFDDGHSLGYGIYEFTVENDTTIDFKLIDWKYEN